MAENTAKTNRQIEVALLYWEGNNDIAIGRKLGLTRERIRQLRKSLRLPKLPRQRKVRPPCLVCGAPVKTYGQKFCSKRCWGYTASKARAKYSCPVCQAPAKQVGGNGKAYYHKCRKGHNLRRTESGLVLTRPRRRRSNGDYESTEVVA